VSRLAGNGSPKKGDKADGAASIAGLNQLEIIKQLFSSILYLISYPKNIKKFRHLQLKEILKKYFKENEKAKEIVVKISRTNSLFW
jgi:hypothetical protein